jgi:DNA modification methylase
MRNAPQTQYLPIDEVKPYAPHLRLHSRRQRRKLEALLRHYGQVIPILVDDSNVVVDGHAVLDAMKSLGYSEIMAVTVRGRDPAEVRALRLALNRVAEDARWEDDRLRAEFADLLQLGFDMELTAFDGVEIDMVLAIKDPAAGVVEESAIEELEPGNEPPTAWLGSTWVLDKHVIACGDARDSDLIGRLTGARAVAAVFTDPPYNVPIDGFVRGLGQTRHREFAMASGEMTPEEFTGFLGGFIVALKPHLSDGAILYICMDWRHMRELLDAGARTELALKNLCIWVKSNAGMGTFYRSQHELVFTWKYGSGPHQNHFELGQFGRSRSNVWGYAGINTFGKDRAELLGVHPTIKPVRLVADALRDVTRRGDLVLDPFLGSGSTLLAAEETGRSCIGVELDPGYLDVAIRRWQRLTGKDAIEATSGEAFDALAHLRSDDTVNDQADVSGSGTYGATGDDRKDRDHE